MTADESFHYAIIKTYAHQVSPLVAHQSDTSVAQANDIVRLPSYLYHYIFSFPYRLMHSMNVTDRASLQTLRLFNVVLGAITLVLLRKLLRRITSTGIADGAVALFALLPITIVTFGGLNYDNLMLPITFGSLLLLLDIAERPSLLKIGWWLTLLECGALTKFTFLPIAVGEIGFLVWVFWRTRPHLSLKKPWQHDKRIVIVCGFFLLLATALFGERYGVNVLKYHSFNPPCQALHSLHTCLQFPLNARNYAAEHDSVLATKNLVAYGATDWYKNMVRGLIYPTSFLFLRFAIAAFLLISAGAIARFRQLGFARREVGIAVLLIALFYTATVFLDDFHQYQRFGMPYAINGRYLLPALPILLVPALANLQRFWTSINRQVRRKQP